MRRFLLVALVLGGAALAAPSATLRGAEPAYSSSLIIGAVTEDRLEQPMGVAVMPSGEVVVADAGMARVQRRTSTGSLQTQWTSFNTSRGTERLGMPAGVAVNSASNIYVADGQRRIVWVFTSNGEHMRTIGAPGAGDGQFLKPAGVALDGFGNVYVVDQEANRVQKFTANGDFVMALGSRGTGQGQLRSPSGVAVDSTGHIYVVDTDNDRVQKFSPAGEFVLQFGGAGIETGKFLRPVGVTLDPQGNVYVADVGNGRVQKFNSNGEFQLRWISSGSWLGAGRSGLIYSSDPLSGRVEQFGSQGQAGDVWGMQGARDGELRSPRAVALSGQGSVVADTANHRIQAFDTLGRGLTTWGGRGSEDGKFESPSGVAADRQGNVYVADTGNNRVQKFTASGSFVAKWGSQGTDDGQFNRPLALAWSAGEVWVLDAGNFRVQKFDDSGRFLATWGGSGDFANPVGLAVDRGGNSYVAEMALGDTPSQAVQKFGPNGALGSRWGSAQLGSVNPSGIAVDTSGNIYLSDQPRPASMFPQTGHDRVVKFSSGGQVLTEMGGSGIAAGKLSGPAGLAVSADGAISVAETLNQRVQVFSVPQLPTPTPPPPPTPTPAPPPADTPRLLGPANGTMLTSLGTTLQFQNPADTTQYQVQIVPQNNDGPAIDLIIADPPLVALGRYVVSAPTPNLGPYVTLPDMSYSWRVRSTNSREPLTSDSPGWRGWSETWGFHTAARSASGSVPVFPQDGAVVQDDILGITWRTPAPDVFYMEVQVSTDPAFELDPAKARTVVWWNLVHGGITGPANTWWPPLLQRGTEYYWRVRPRVQGDGKPVAWSDTWRFRVSQ